MAMVLDPLLFTIIEHSLMERMSMKESVVYTGWFTCDRAMASLNVLTTGISLYWDLSTEGMSTVTVADVDLAGNMV